MTQPEQGQYPQEVTVDSQVFERMQRGVEQALGKGFDELTFEEASRVVGSVAMTITQGDSGSATVNGQVVVDSEADSREALSGFARQWAEHTSYANDGQELIIHVTRNKTLWDSIRGREPEVERSFRFRNEPPQHI